MVTTETRCGNADAMFYSCKSQFREKNLFFRWEMSVSCTSQEYVWWCYNAFLFCSSICQVVTYERFQTKASFKLLDLKVVVVAYERCWVVNMKSEIRWSELETFGILENWSLTRGGRNRRFDSLAISHQFRFCFNISRSVSKYNAEFKDDLGCNHSETKRLIIFL